MIYQHQKPLKKHKTYTIVLVLIFWLSIDIVNSNAVSKELIDANNANQTRYKATERYKSNEESIHAIETRFWIRHYAHLRSIHFRTNEVIRTKTHIQIR